jgi:predicted PurR-regulated permease PerM
VVVQAGWSFVNVIMNSVLTFVALFYFLVGGKGLMRGAFRLVPAESRDRLQHLVESLDTVLCRYLYGLAVVVVFAALVVWLVFGFVFHIPNAAVFALTIGLLELVPLFGPITSGVLTSVAALTHGGILFTVKVIVFYLALRFSIDQVIGPIVLGNAVTLSPIVVLFAFLAGGTLFGFLGLLFAVPAAAIFKIVLDERNAG